MRCHSSLPLVTVSGELGGGDLGDLLAGPGGAARDVAVGLDDVGVDRDALVGPVDALADRRHGCLAYGIPGAGRDDDRR